MWDSFIDLRMVLARGRVTLLSMLLGQAAFKTPEERPSMGPPRSSRLRKTSR